MGLRSDFDGDEGGRREVVRIVGSRRVLFVPDFLKLIGGRLLGISPSLTLASERGKGESWWRRFRW